MVTDPRTEHLLAIHTAGVGLKELRAALETARVLAEGDMAMVLAAVGDNPPQDSPGWYAKVLTERAQASIGAAMSQVDRALLALEHAAEQV